VNADRRIAALRSRLQDEGADVLVVGEPANLTYLTGFDGVFDEERAHAALITSGELLLFTDGRYAEVARNAAAKSPWSVRVPKERVLAAACDEVLSSGAGHVAMEDSLAHQTFVFVTDRLGMPTVPASRWVEEIRQVKDPEEIERIAAAQELTDRALEHILGFVSAGMTEREVALELEFFMRREGSDGLAFPPIVASGPNSALPHAKVTDRVVESGDFLKMDFGARIDGYCADMTRTVVIGHAGERQRELYAAVLAANLAAIEAVAPGLTGKEIDQAGREVLAKRDLGELFTHGIGHGVGLEVHELPGVGPSTSSTLQAGNVITIEPGVYEAGFGGVRIEDLVVVEQDGAHVLTRSAKDLIEL
jgi:Xaa-Pro aminopeptidase